MKKFDQKRMKRFNSVKSMKRSSNRRMKTTAIEPNIGKAPITLSKLRGLFYKLITRNRESKNVFKGGRV